MKQKEKENRKKKIETAIKKPKYRFLHPDVSRPILHIMAQKLLVITPHSHLFWNSWKR